jgi:hypothetical protein
MAFVLSALAFMGYSLWNSWSGSLARYLVCAVVPAYSQRNGKIALALKFQAFPRSLIFREDSSPT